MIWITEGKEVENYLSAVNLGRAVGESPIPVDKFSAVFTKVKLRSYEKKKVEFAHLCTEAMTAADLDVLDLKRNISILIDAIRSWNGMI
jgi:hypothetical protein